MSATHSAAPDDRTPSVEVSVVDGLGHLRLNRPAKRNAIDAKTVQEAKLAVSRLLARDVRVALLESSGDVFCSGADRAELGLGLESTEELAALLVETPIYWAARIQGPTLGGAVALVASCPLAVCTPSAWFELPEARSGVLRDPTLPLSTMQCLAEVISPRRALDMAVFAERISAATAVELGLVTCALPLEQLDRFLDSRLRPLLATPSLAVAAGRAWQARFTRVLGTRGGS